jgi:hypothetical protein
VKIYAVFSQKLKRDPCRFTRQVNKISLLEAKDLRNDPCRLVRQVNQIL